MFSGQHPEVVAYEIAYSPLSDAIELKTILLRKFRDILNHNYEIAMLTKTRQHRHELVATYSDRYLDVVGESQITLYSVLIQFYAEEKGKGRLVKRSLGINVEHLNKLQLCL